ncbi:aspartate/glutamate racemase family protein [Paraherbaspirillum soli]|uniref:Aspartate/glutamate racemase family protein n=1 Tax=Paraherbaspirillum soli TaxID=631222 RepID=A0ABW0M5B6_9BURK
MRTIGMIGGMSWESSVEYYRLLNQGSKALLGGHHNARSLMLTVNFHDIEQLQHQGRWDALAEHMADAARQLAAGGADCIILCTNTMHKVWPAIEQAVAIPVLHIADPTAAAIKRAGLSRVGLLGTRFTMEQDFYRGRLEAMHGLQVLVPEEADRALVHSVIYDELCHGRINDASRAEFQRVIQGFKEQGAQGVVLGCTEIMLLIKPEDSALPTFDTTALHVQAALQWATA